MVEVKNLLLDKTGLVSSSFIFWVEDIWLEIGILGVEHLFFFFLSLRFCMCMCGGCLQREIGF